MHVQYYILSHVIDLGNTMGRAFLLQFGAVVNWAGGAFRNTN